MPMIIRRKRNRAVIRMLFLMHRLNKKNYELRRELHDCRAENQELLGTVAGQTETIAHLRKQATGYDPMGVSRLSQVLKLRAGSSN